MAGAVNTLALRNDGVFGDNTDGAGLVADLTRNLSFDLKGTRVLLLGAGGAARGVLGPLLEADPEYLEIANRNAERAAELAREYSTLGTVHGCGFDGIAESTFDLVLNATSASLQDTIPPIPPGVIGADHAVLRHGVRQRRYGVHALVARAPAPDAPRRAGACWSSRPPSRSCSGAASSPTRRRSSRP